jgi:hypothetical protein
MTSHFNFRLSLVQFGGKENVFFLLLKDFLFSQTFQKGCVLIICHFHKWMGFMNEALCFALFYKAFIFSAMTFSLMTLSIMSLNLTLSITNVDIICHHMSIIFSVVNAASHFLLSCWMSLFRMPLFKIPLFRMPLFRMPLFRMPLCRIPSLC